MQKVVTLEEVLNLARWLSPVAQIKQELAAARPTLRKSLRGLWL